MRFTFTFTYRGQLVIRIRDKEQLYTIKLSLADTQTLRDMLHPIQLAPMNKRPDCQ